MTVKRSCTEYWLDTAAGTFRGQFEEMYRDIEDPWGCESAKTSLNNRLFTEIIFDGDRRFERILDVGSGLGGLLSILAARNGGGFVLGLDVSHTAVEKATQRYPELSFERHDLAKEDLAQSGFGLVTISEVLWYVLDDLETFFGRAIDALTPGGVLAIHQYFPAEQKYGRDKVDGVSGFLEYMRGLADVKSEHMYTNHRRDGLVLLSTFIKG